MANPWNGKVVLEAFWWNCWNSNYPHAWYTYLAKLAHRIAALGFDGIWTMPPCKYTSAVNNMGYTPYDYYDLGQKNQTGAVSTRFGAMDAFLRLVAVAHANGLEVYPGYMDRTTRCLKNSLRRIPLSRTQANATKKQTARPRPPQAFPASLPDDIRCHPTLPLAGGHPA